MEVPLIQFYMTQTCLDFSKLKDAEILKNLSEWQTKWLMTTTTTLQSYSLDRFEQVEPSKTCHPSKIKEWWVFVTNPITFCGRLKELTSCRNFFSFSSFKQFWACNKRPSCWAISLLLPTSWARSWGWEGSWGCRGCDFCCLPFSSTILQVIHFCFTPKKLRFVNHCIFLSKTLYNYP